METESAGHHRSAAGDDEHARPVPAHETISASWARYVDGMTRPARCRPRLSRVIVDNRHVDRLRDGSVTNGGDKMNVLLWVLQVLLAAAFLAHGLLLLFPPAAVVEQ